MIDMTNTAKLIAVAGPTATGKSALAVDLALALDGEVISCDSMQIYRTMDIGTGKVTKEEARGVVHRMIDVADPNEEYSLADFISAARRAIEKTLTCGKLPIVCGGTGLYLDRLLDGTAFSEAGGDGEVRAQLEKRTSEDLYAELCRVDPESAAATHRNNRKRVIRALEIYRATGRTKSDWDRASHPEEAPYRALRILLLPEDRAKLYAAIEKRVDGMFEKGLEKEARALAARSCAATAAQAIGYKEFLPYFEGQCSLEDVKNQIKQSSRRYAKRQLTWFRANAGRENAVVIDPFAKDPAARALEAAKAFLRASAEE